MLPIDTLTERAEALLCANGRTTDGIYAALRLDRSVDGAARDTFLALTEDGRLLRLDPETESYEEFLLTELTKPYADSLLSAVRLLAVYTPPGEEARTVLLGDATAACRGRLFVFLSVMEALLRGERMSGEEGLFEGIAPRKEEEHERTRGAILRLAMRFLRSPAILLIAAVALVIEIGSDLLRPYLSGTILFDEIITEGGRFHSYGALFLCLAGLIALALLRWGSILLRNILLQRIVYPAKERLQETVFERMQARSLSFYNNASIGRLNQYLAGDVHRLHMFFSESVSLIIYAAEFIGVLILLFTLNWRLSLFILVPIPLVVLIYRRAFPHLRRLDARAARENSAVSTKITDSLSGVRVVKAFSKEEEEAENLAKRLARLYRVNLDANLIGAILGPSVALLIYLANQTIWGVGGLFVMEGAITYGEFCTYLGYVGMVFAPLQFFSSFAMLVGQTSESATRLVGILDATPEIRDAENAVTLDHLRGEIEFRDVSFHYTQSRPILRGTSFRIRAGEHIGLVGHTGCGKSTIANLLLRMYDVTGGRILIDGHDVRTLTAKTLRSHISIVSQEIHLFMGTVRDNIRFGRPDATDEEVILAARAAGAHEFIMELPEGYETRIGRGGSVDLSGGERQRISIARAIVTDPDILILDEATAAMDNETERRIAEAISSLIRGKTTISIAHRLSTLRDCTGIMAMDGGRIAEAGTREELLARDGIFKKLYTLQEGQLEQVLKGVTEDENA